MIGTLIAFTVCSWTADLLLTLLIPDHPAVLLGLSDGLRNYLLASPHTGAPAYFTIAFVRIGVQYWCYFLLGRWYGDAAVHWMERRTPTVGRFVRRAELWFSKAPYPLVVLFPLNSFCVLAGASEMSALGFLVARSSGAALVIVAARELSDVLDVPLRAIGDWIGTHRLPMFLGGVVVVTAMIVSERRSGGATDLTAMTHLDEEIRHPDRDAAVDPMDRQDDIDA